MRSSLGRIPSGSSRSRGKSVRSAWLVVCAFGVMAMLWIRVVLILLPGKLDDISTALTPGDTGHEDFAARREKPSLPPRVAEAGITMEEITARMRSFLDELTATYAVIGKLEPAQIWSIYTAAADTWLKPIDRDSKGKTLFEVRDDKSLFVSIASYRDENCPVTLEEMYSKAGRPEMLFVGLVQQNCASGCRSGVLEGGKIEDVEPDINCYDAFCATETGKSICGNNQVRNFFIDEANALGPAVARYFASKLWYGETFFLQIDAHMLFRKDWDIVYVRDIQNTPSYPQSVLSHYPPDTTTKNYWDLPGYRMCGATFATSSIEYEIIRLAAGIREDEKIHPTPCPAPFIGAGLFFAHATFLADVPFDPYLPWVFMGEEILLSLRFWTWGYDIYSPTQNVLSHFYVRRHKPKFWETVNRLFKNPAMHNDITRIIIQRVKHIAGYPESSREILQTTTPSLLTGLELYGEGSIRSMEDYMAMVGIDMSTKRVKPNTWCVKCKAPYPV